MARYTGAVCRLCRREGQKLFLKGERCYTGKCAVERRQYAPGQHGQARNRKASEYGLQLRTKQHAKRYYGVLEGQFRHYFEMAEKMQGVTGENLLRLLESRLDNVIYRLGFASSRAEARQLCQHGHFTVNGRKVNIPSYLTKPGQVMPSRMAAASSRRLRRSSKPTRAVRFRSGWISIAMRSRRRLLLFRNVRTLICRSKRP